MYGQSSQTRYKMARDMTPLIPDSENYSTAHYIGPDDYRILSICSVDNNVDGQFDAKSPIAQQYGVGTKNCQLYMAERCAKNWDGICDVASLNNDITNPDMGSAYGTGNARNIYGGNMGARLPAGQLLVRQAAQRRYCNLDESCEKKVEPFFATGITGPMVTSYRFVGKPIKCKLTKDGVYEKDNLLNLALENPSVCADILDEICVESAGSIPKTSKLYSYCKSKQLAQ